MAHTNGSREAAHWTVSPRGAGDEVPAGLDHRVVFDQTPSPCVVLDPELVIRDCNAAYLDTVDHSRGDLLGRGLFDVFPDLTSTTGESAGVVRRGLMTAIATARASVLGVLRYDMERAGSPGGAAEVRYWSSTAVPLLDDRGAVAWLLLSVHDVTALAAELREADPTPGAGLPLGATGAAAAAVAEQSHLFDKGLEAERLLGTSVQALMLPSRVPEAVERVAAVAVRYRPASKALSVGGDWYDVTDVGDGRIAVTVGDVVGHGLSAASAMGQLRSALAALTVAGVGPPQALVALDRIARLNDDAVGSTAVKVVVDSELTLASYSSAGHPPPLLVRPDGTVAQMDAALGPPLAVTAEVQSRPLGSIAVHPGDTLVLYTDGLVERRDEDIDEGINRLVQALARHRRMDVQALADQILAELAPEQELRDDVALVVVRL